LETYTRRSRIQSLKAELDLRQQACELLKREFEKRPLTYDQQSEIFRRWEDALKESQLLQSLLQMLECEEKQAEQSSEGQQALQTAQQVSSFTWFYHARS
jgi:hypothetical protein